MQDKLEAYLKARAGRWSPVTIQNTRSSLQSLLSDINGDAPHLWNRLKNMAPNSRVTTWHRVLAFWDYLEGGKREGNPYRQFKFENARFFKNAYVRRPATQSLTDAKAKIEKIEDPAIRRKATELLLSGMRFTESLTYKDGWIMGKGEKPRQVLLPKVEGPDFTNTYRTFHRALKEVGLKPHDLRKIFLTCCVKRGADIFELMRIAGWSSLETARSYIGVNNDRLSQISNEICQVYDGRREENPRRIASGNKARS